MFDYILIYFITPLVILTALVVLHELGHYIVAKKYGIPVTVFSIGFGKEIWGRTDKSGTRWRLAIIPLGGYVSMKGLESYPLHQRVWVTAGGPLANFVTAILMMFLVSYFYGAPALSSHVAGVSTSGGAYQAGILPGDKFMSLDGEDLPVDIDGVKEKIIHSTKDYVVAVIERDHKTLEIKIPIRDMRKTGDFGEDYQQKMMGVFFAGQNFKLSAVNTVNGVNTQDDAAAARTEIIKNFGKRIVVNFGKGKDRDNILIHVDAQLNQGLLDKQSNDYKTLVLQDRHQLRMHPMSLIDSALQSIDLFYKSIKGIVGGFYQAVVLRHDAPILQADTSMGDLTGGAIHVADVVGPYFLFKLAVIFSIFIGFINLLPFPMLDGVHLFLYAVEGVTGRPSSLKLRGYVYGVGMMFIFLVIVMANARNVIDKILSN